MTHDHMGIVIANNRDQAQIGLDRLGGLIGAAVLANHHDWLVFTRNNFDTAGRGCQAPNRIVVFDISPQAIPDDMWHAIIPCIRRNEGEPLNVTYVSRETVRTDLIIDHRFTGLRQWGMIAPPDKPCQFQIDGEICGKRQDEHRARPIARSAQELIDGR